MDDEKGWVQRKRERASRNSKARWNWNLESGNWDQFKEMVKEGIQVWEEEYSKLGESEENEGSMVDVKVEKMSMIGCR